MSDEVYHEDVKTVSRDGVTVERELVCREAGITGSFEVTSRRDDPVQIQVVDELPEYFPIDSVAFEPDSAPDSGDISKSRVVATQVVAEDTVRIRYGIVPSEPVAEVRWSAPTIQHVESVEAADADVAGGEATGGSVGPVSDLPGLFDEASGSDAGSEAGDPVTGDTVVEPSSESVDGPPGDAEGESAGDADVEPSAADPVSANGAQVDGNPDGSGGDGGHAEYGGVDGTGDEDSGDGATVAEPSADAGNGTGEVTPDGMDAGPVAETPGEAGSDIPGSFEARLDHLSARVEEFAAYAAAVEPLIDERGGGSQLLGDIESDLAGLDRRLDAVRAEVETVREEREAAVTDLQEGLDRVDEALDGVAEELDTMETEVDGLELGLDSAESDLRSLEDRADDHDDAIGAVENDVAGLEERVEDQADDVESVESDVGGVESDLRALESRVDGFEEELADLGETVESVEDELATLSETVESMSDELAGIHDEVETLHEFRKSLAQISNVEE